MKKFVSLCTAVGILATAMSAYALPVVKKTEPTVVSMTFDDITTNGDPYGVMFSEASLYVRQLDMNVKNKVLEVSKKAPIATADFGLSEATDKMGFSFDLMLESLATERRIQVVDVAGTDSTAFTIRTDGKLISPDGRTLGTVKPGEWNTFDLMYRKASSRFELYRNGKCILSNALITNIDKFGQFKRLRFWADGGGYDSKFYIDNVHIYKGNKRLGNKGLATSYSDTTTEEVIETEIVDDSHISQNASFDNETVGAYPETMYQAMTADPVLNPGNKLQIVDFPSAENKSFLIEKAEQNNAGPAIDFPLDISVAHYAHVEFKVMIPENKANVGLRILFRSDNPSWNNIIVFYTNGICTVGDKVNSEYTLNEWHDCHVLVNCREMTFESVELDGKVIAENIPYPDRKAISPTILRIEHTTNGSFADQFYMDDLRIYNGKERKNQEELNQATEGAEFSRMITPQDQVQAWTKDAVAMMTKSNKVVVRSERKTIPVSAQQIDNQVYLPAAFATESFGGTVSFDEDSGKVSVKAGNNNATYTVGATECTINGATDETKAAPLVVEDTLMLPIEEFSKWLDISLTWYDDFCLVVMDGEKKAFQHEQLEDIFDYLSYHRPKTDEIKAKFEEAGTAGMHPRVLVKQDDFDRVREMVKTDPTAKAWYEELLAQAEAKMENEGPPVIDLEYLAANSTVSSIQGTFLTQARTLVDRAILMSLLYNINGDERYVEWLGKEIDVWTGLETWNPGTTQQLTVAEAACGISIAYDWCYDYWSPERRKAMEDIIGNQAFWMFEGGYDYSLGFSTRWTENENNTNFVVAGGSGVAALAFMEAYPERARKLLENAFISIENGLITYVPAGATLEGPSYWDYQTTYLSWMMMTAINTIGTDFGYVTENPFLKLGSRYYTYMQSRQGVNNVADAGGENQQSSEVLWLAKIYEDRDLARAKLDEFECNQMALYPLDLLFYDPGFAKEKADLPLDLIYGDQALFHNEYHTQDSIYVSMHAGDNASLHGNIDAGTFLIDALGVRWARELGHDSYDQKNYFQPKYRNNFYKLTSQGQNVLAINPTTDSGQTWNGVVEFSDFKSSGRGGYAVIDMKNAYGSYVNSAQRGIKLDTDRSQIVVQDEIDLRGKNDVYWFMHTPTTPQIVDNGKGILLKSNGKTMYMSLQTNISSAKFTIENPTPLPGSGVNPSVWSLGQTKRLQIHMPKVSGKVNIAVRFIPMEDKDVPENLADIEVAKMVPINQWTAEEGEYVARPLLDGITVDGNPIDGFSKRVNEYLLEYPHDTDKNYLPVIGASANTNEVTLEVTQPKDLDDVATITVTSKKDTTKSRVYQVDLNLLPWLGVPGGRVERKPVALEASLEPTPATNGVDKAFDDDNSTYFYNGGKGEWFIADLGSEQHVDVVSIRNHVGNTRRSFFDIEVSKDGKKWTKVFSDGSSGKSAEYENYSIGDHKIRYIRITGYGNSNSDASSYNDIKFYGKGE